MYMYIYIYTQIHPLNPNAIRRTPTMDYNEAREAGFLKGYSTNS